MFPFCYCLPLNNTFVFFRIVLLFLQYNNLDLYVVYTMIHPTLIQFFEIYVFTGTAVGRRSNYSLQTTHIYHLLLLYSIVYKFSQGQFISNLGFMFNVTPANGVFNRESPVRKSSTLHELHLDYSLSYFYIFLKSLSKYLNIFTKYLQSISIFISQNIYRKNLSKYLDTNLVIN